MLAEKFASARMSGQVLNEPLQNVSSFHPLSVNTSHYYHASANANELSTPRDWRKDPGISFSRNLVRRTISELLNLKANCQWQQLPPDFVVSLENQLFEGAASEEDYFDQDRLIYRLQNLIQHTMFDVNCIKQTSYYPVPSGMVMPALDLTHGCNSDAAVTPHEHMKNDMTLYNQITACNAYQLGCQTGQLINPSNRVVELPEIQRNYSSSAMGMRQIASETVFSPDMGSTITTCSSAEGFSDIGDSGLRPFYNQSDYHCSPKASFKGNFQKQDMDLDLLQCKSPIPEHNQHQLCQPHFSEQNVFHCPVAEQRGVTRHQLLSQQSHSFPIADSSNGLQLSMEHKILLAYINQKSAVNRSGNCMVSCVNHLHSTLCNSSLCMCERYWLLLEHFEGCHCNKCHICGPVRSLCLNDQNLLAADHVFVRNFSNTDYGGSGSSYREDVLSSAKRLKPSSHFSGNSRTLKRLKMDDSFSHSENGIASILSSLMVQTPDLEKLPPLQQWPESPQSINSETLGLNIDVLKIPGTNEHCSSCSVDNHHKSNAASMLSPLEEIIFGFKSEISGDLRSSCEIASNVEDAFDQQSDSLPILCNSMDEVSQVTIEPDPETIVKEKELNVPESAQKAEVEPENPRIRVVSLIDLFTMEQIKQHISSLCGQKISEDQKECKSVDSFNESICQLCTSDKLLLAPQPIYCSRCGFRIKSGVVYYSTQTDKGLQHCFCTLCYRMSRGGSITFLGISIPKAKLDKRKNHEEIEEPWVQCDKCKQWQHQICALFNDKIDSEGKAEYVCPKCCLKERESGVSMPLMEAAGIDAKDLPSTMLSDYIEQRLFRCLQQEREARAKASRKNVDEVPGAEDLVVRVVLSANKWLKVNKQFLEFHGEKYPAEFSYQSKVILLFQKIDGVDVCLFGFYVQEFGSECSHPNQRCVYISYLDSVKYFRPETKTASGEALRTFVYHEILIGYLEYCKKRGFVTCYLWACPPVKGEDYILNCHPWVQKTPKSDKLRQWYQSMLRKAAKENIVVNCTNLYDQFFVSSGQNNSKITAARLPYFDGDFWSGAAENFIKNFEQQSGEYSRKMKKTLTKRTLKAMGHTDSSDGATKDILLMQKLGQTISPYKEDFIIAQLQFVCTHCHEAILSGWQWRCSQCKSFQLCERCHDAEHRLNGAEIHIVNIKEKHPLSKVMVEDVPSDTLDQDVILQHWLFDNRHNFLGFCQKNHYQFDTLRRAKYSSMMILYQLHNPTMQHASGVACSLCHRDIDNKDSDTCSSCHQKKVSSLQIQKMNKYSSGTESKDEPKLMEKEVLDVLQHASRCRTSKSNPCSYPNCLLIKKLFRHASSCTTRFAGGCPHCQKAWFMLKLHSRECKTDCSVPRCKDLKKHAEMLASQSETRWRGKFAGLGGKQIPEDCISKL